MCAVERVTLGQIIQKRTCEVIRRAEPYVRRSGASLQERECEDGVNLFWGTELSMSPGVMCRGIWKAPLTAAPVSSNGTTPIRPWDIWPDQLAGGLVPKAPPLSPFTPLPHHPYCPVWGYDTQSHMSTTKVLDERFKTVPELFLFFVFFSWRPILMLHSCQSWCDYYTLWEHLSLTTCCIVPLNLSWLLPLCGSHDDKADKNLFYQSKFIGAVTQSKNQVFVVVDLLSSLDRWVDSYLLNI